MTMRQRIGSHGRQKCSLLPALLAVLCSLQTRRDQRDELGPESGDQRGQPSGPKYPNPTARVCCGDAEPSWRGFRRQYRQPWRRENKDKNESKHNGGEERINSPTVKHYDETQ
eukprot:scpid44606/ scgid27800/ 